MSIKTTYYSNSLPHLDSPDAYPPHDTDDDNAALFEKFLPLAKLILDTEKSVSSRELMTLFNINQTLSDKIVTQLKSEEVFK